MRRTAAARVAVSAPFVIAAVLVTAAVPGCAPSTIATPTVSSYSAASPAPVAAPAAAVAAAPGEIRLAPGPFTDRVAVTATRLDGPTVRGKLAVTTEVSEILALEVHAAFYDSTGHLLGTGIFQHSDEGHATGGPHAPHDDGLDFEITAPPATAAVSAAVLSIPVLVNE
ncbi:hypothetical protein ACIP5Y_20595 [Nocardia sp. NPDC088792]|uniref:hypothetical protein n=1 Tax=Nocardia sp. NPDC088792 TaxID=3364332 RepID=UPI00383062AC